MENIFRKEEFDWGQNYLARTEGSAKAALKWELDLSECKMSVQSIELDVGSATYENGRVIWQLCGGSVCLLPMSGECFEWFILYMLCNPHIFANVFRYYFAK